MNQHRNKRRLRAHLVFIYGLMVFSVISIVAILILVILGYRYNAFDGKVEQGGLVQFDSRPSGATVAVDGTNLANRTASKITLTAGSHTIMMSRDGYGSWTKKVTVKPGSVLWLNYALLFPNKPTLSTAETFATVTSALPAPNEKKLATVSDDSGAIQVTTLDVDTPTTTKVTIPADNYTAAAEGEASSFELLQWDKDSRYLLMRYTHGTSHEYLSVDTQDSSAHNLTKGLGVDIMTVTFSASDANTVYLVNAAHELRRASVREMTMTGPLASNVSTVQASEKNLVVYATLPDDSGARTVGYVSSGAVKAKTIRSYSSLSADASLLGLSGTYYGEHYTVIAHGESVDILRGDLPTSENADELTLSSAGSFTITGGAQYLGFTSELNRLVYAQNSTTVATYDLELATITQNTLPADQHRHVEWIDGYHFGTTGDHNGSYAEYDGTNGVTFATNISDLPIVLSSGNKYLYYFVPTDASGVKLMRAKMTTN